MAKDKKIKDKAVSTAEEAETVVVESSGDTGIDSAEMSPEARIEELEDKVLRTLADFDNFKKRTARQFEDVISTANDKLFGELLEVVDNFERALEHNGNSCNDTDDNGAAENADALRQGTELIYNQLIGLLKRYDIKPIDSLGKPFDPNLHEALMTTPSDEYEKGYVAMEIGRGYMLGSRVLRHARVGVSSGQNENDKTESE